MLLNWKETHPDPAEIECVYMLATAVSSRILKTMAEMEGFHFEVSENRKEGYRQWERKTILFLLYQCMLDDCHS